MPWWGLWGHRGGQCRTGRVAGSCCRLLFAGHRAGSPRTLPVDLGWMWPGQPLARPLPKSLFIAGKWPDHFFKPATRLQRDTRLPAPAGVGQAKQRREIPWPFCNVS